MATDDLNINVTSRGKKTMLIRRVVKADRSLLKDVDGRTVSDDLLVKEIRSVGKKGDHIEITVSVVPEEKGS